jgi:hypothetical protein
MARIFERYIAAIIAQASAAITADAFSAGAETPLDKAASANADGAQWFDCYVNVTVAPTTAASCELWVAGSPDGINYADYEYGLTCAVPVATGRYHLGPLYSTPLEFKAKIKAIGFGFTAALEIVPVYPADA